LPHSGRAFPLPPNLYILGTMNTADRSIALLDTALRRRFHFEDVPPDPRLLATVRLWDVPVDLPAVLGAINDRLEFLLGPDQRLGHGWFMNLTDKAGLDAVMARKIIPLLREYFHEDLGRVRAVLGGGNGFLRAQVLPTPPGMGPDFGPDRRHG
jgi:5-methylcytosine-specific restriction endonuclease McrBC GTP-binding regulatory subunit McrB